MSNRFSLVRDTDPLRSAASALRPETPNLPQAAKCCSNVVVVIAEVGALWVAACVGGTCGLVNVQAVQC